MTTQQSSLECFCCQHKCWPMWTTINNKTYCNGCYYIGCPTKPAECKRPLCDRIVEKVADAIRDAN